MADSRIPGPTGKTVRYAVEDGTSARRDTSSPGPVGRRKNSATTKDVLRRIKDWRGLANFTGLFPDAVKALDHYLGGKGTFVEIPASKVKSVRADAEAIHLQKSRDAFKGVAIMEAGAAWLAANGFPTNGGKLVPPRINFLLTYQTGTVSRGVTNDNLTYFGSSIMSEVRFQAEQLTVPTDPNEESFDIKISVVQWKSWVVDNYDWEGDKKFGFFPSLGLPTQKEMNSLQTAGLAKSYQRSSRSWIVKDHGMSSWTETPYAMKTLQEVAKSRQASNLRKVKDRNRERKMGALPTPRSAEEMVQGRSAPAK